MRRGVEMILSVLLLHVFLWNWKLQVRPRVTVSELKLAYSEFYADKKQPGLVVTEGDERYCPKKKKMVS